MSNQRGLQIGIGIAQGLDQGIKNFFTMKQVRMQQEQDREMFDLNKKTATLKLKAMEADPSVQPGAVALARKSLKLGIQTADAQFKKQAKLLDREEWSNQQKVQHLGQQAEMYNQLQEQNPELFGDMQIVPDLETGNVTLKARSASESKVQSDIERNQSTIQKNRVATARDMAKDEFGSVDEAKFQQYLKDMGSTLGSAGATSVPAWVPKGKEDQYSQAKQHYSDDEIKQYFGG